MLLLAIDPGTTESAYVIYETETKKIVDHNKLNNLALLDDLLKLDYDFLVAEMFKSYGFQVGDSVLETCVWLGRFVQNAKTGYELISRKTVVSEICGKATANDSHIRTALIAYFSDFLGLGVGEVRGKGAIGLKSNPGPLYGITKDQWSALAIAVAWSDIKSREFRNFLT